MTRTITPRDFAHAATVCAKLEVELRATISRTQRAIEDAQAELQNMLDALNDGRAARGLPPLDYSIPEAEAA